MNDVSAPAMPPAAAPAPTPAEALALQAAAPQAPAPASGMPRTSPALDALGSVMLDVTVELGRCRMPLSEVAALDVGSVVELEARAGEPLPVLVNGRVVAYGEPVVVDGQMALRVISVGAQ